MGEVKESQENTLTFAVKTQAIRADWIINEEIGQVFLHELKKQQNDAVFMSRYVDIIIEYLYE